MSVGEDGPETPSAPESPSPEPPQEPAEPAVGEAAESGRPRLLPVWILLGAAALSGGAWAVTEHMGSGPPAPDEASVRLITASTEPWKVRPADPGGMEIPNQGTLIYETLATADPEEAPERVLPPPEEPMSPPQPEADRAEELAVAASGIERDPAALQPDAGGVDEPAPAPIEEAPTSEPEVIEPQATEPEAPMGEAVVRPHPPKPGTLAAIQIDVTPLPDLDEPAMVEEAPPHEPETPTTVEEIPQLDPETLALVEEILQREAETSSPPAQEEYARQEYVGSVPLPLYKPVSLARTAPAERPVDDVASKAREAAPEPVQSDSSRTWRYVQLGAANSRSSLEGHWEMLRRRHNDVLVGLSPLIMPVDSGDSGITYRLRAGPLSDAGAAQQVCTQLKARGLACFVPRD